MINKIIYCTSADITRSNGPGVNEREFINSLSKVWEHEFEVISNYSDPKNKKVRFHILERHTNPFHYLKREIKLYRRLKTFDKPNTFFVFRIGIAPIAYFLFTVFCKSSFALKTSGDGSFQLLRDRSILYIPFLFFNKWLLKRVLKKAKFIDAVSKSHVLSLQRIFSIDSSRIGVIDNAVNINKFFPEINSATIRKDLEIPLDAMIIGYTGNLPFTRGGREILHLLAKDKENKQLNLYGLILGDDGDKIKLEKEAEKLHVSDRVRILGRVDYIGIEKYVALLDVGVSFLEKRHRGASEQKVRQYLACGIPALVTPGSSSFVKEAGIGWVSELNEFDKAYWYLKKLKKFSEEERQLLSTKCRNYALTFLSSETQQKKRLKYWFDWKENQ